MEVAVKGKAKRRHLNAEECDGLGRSAQGTDVLTQPHTFNQRMRNRNPNWGLYPRTPTKRPKFAPATGSPSGRQKGIGEFFSVTRVLSSSPQKSSLPSTSKEGPKAVEEEEDEDDDISLLAVPLAPELRGKEDEEIDDSLFAAVMMPEPQADEEEEIDDDSLLAVEMPQSKAREEPEVDYLEGMTAEMFGNDDEFDQCDIHNEEEEVEALPDAHYGLLGSSNALLKPQGCMDDLPEEVLREVLCLIPAQDLYRNISLVCHRWRNIVEDETFVPFKKKYYRYMMTERQTVLEVFSILKSSGVTDSASADHSIRKLVVLMAQHKVGERVRPEDVLERVKKHRLFPQAEASIRLRIPDIQKHFNLGITGVNPYAAMAVILILSESVGDVQALVSLLMGCMSHLAITEYLCHMAMMLLSLERNKITVSNRLHYNIYYVLHLMENGPFPVSCPQSRQPQFHLTQEQQQILSHNIQDDHVVKIIAFAGTGKTTTLVKYAEQRPHLRFLYVAFNNSVASEARRRFPSNVDCKTVHSLAYHDVGKRYKFREKLATSLNPFTISYVLPSGRGGFTKAKVVMTTLNAFMASADQTITVDHVPSSHVTHKGNRKIIDEHEKVLVVHDAQRIWNKMKDLNEKSKEAYYMIHDGYLKLWQLSDPKPCLSDVYNALFIDEAQDCTPAIMDVLLSQRCGKILVGDPHQQIYTFRGAVNALNYVEHTHIYYLTQSFRFGAEIAYVGATILRVCKGVQKILVGGKQKGGVCDDAAVRVVESVRAGTCQNRGKTAILSRCNFGVFSEAVHLTDANPNCRLHFIGDIKNIGLDRIMDIWYLMQQQQEGYERTHYFKDRLIRSFVRRNENPFYTLKKYVEQTEDNDLHAKLTIVETYRKRIPELVSRLKACSQSDFHDADFIVGTVHKAKGLEFDTVMVTDDFAKVPCSKHNLRHNPDFSFAKIPDDEWNLLYVAVTRAKTTLIITKNILRIITMAGEYFLKSEMPSSLLKSDQPLPCSIANCPNCVTPGSAFIMRRQQMRCTDWLAQGGPLCERCIWTRIGPIAFLMTDDVLSMAEIPQRLDLPVHHAFFLELFF
ncbi:F-box DNA helicase 1 isoform X2 [Archocentrus centrarchus]|uniref:F-box DNA helicase 1 isoform X2 n=1 Tax=Archocentrus centrarchus TaxID=63155 RepID=UPI0011E9CBC9|nr:F-box DNA helicase 1 isoform X2 [Archocentrus centrarchus]